MNEKTVVGVHWSFWVVGGSLACILLLPRKQAESMGWLT